MFHDVKRDRFITDNVARYHRKIPKCVSSKYASKYHAKNILKKMILAMKNFFYSLISCFQELMKNKLFFSIFPLCIIPKAEYSEVLGSGYILLFL